jgi:hypothetical protein
MSKKPTPAPQQGGSTTSGAQQQGQSDAQPQAGTTKPVFRDWASI